VAQSKKDAAVEIKNASCWASPRCHNHCRIAAEVQDGKLIRDTGHPEAAEKGVGLTNQGSGCNDRMPLFARWLYDDPQLKYPPNGAVNAAGTHSSGSPGSRPRMKSAAAWPSGVCCAWCTRRSAAKIIRFKGGQPPLSLF